MNIYANQEWKIYSGGVGKTKDWVDTKNYEMKAFYSHRYPTASCSILQVNTIASSLICKWLKKIVENIYCHKNVNKIRREHPNHDKLYKLWPLITKLMENWIIIHHIFLLMKQWSHSMVGVQWSNICWWSQAREATKVWCLSDLQTGYVINFDIYNCKCSKTSTFSLGESSFETRQRVCRTMYFSLVTTFLWRQTLWNIYSKIVYLSWNCAIQSQRSTRNENFQTGEFLFEMQDVLAVKCMENCPVTFLTTLHNECETSTVKLKNKDDCVTQIFCTVVVEEHNPTVGGVDCFDQLRARYSIGCWVVKWWHRLFYFLIYLTIENNFTTWKLNNRYKGKHDQPSFRIRLARQLIAGYSSKKR